MTYKELMNQIKEMDPKMLNKQVVVFVFGPDDYFPVESGLNFTEESVESEAVGKMKAGYPYLEA